jgi:hypothetical protein
MKTNEDKELDELLDPAYPKASVTYALTSPKGFGLLFTMRSKDEGELFDLMESTEKFLTDKGYTPEVKYSRGGGKSGGASQPQLLEGQACPKCGQPLVKFQTKTGKSGVRCSTNKWDPATKQATGCDYIQWDEDKPTQASVPASPMQKSALIGLGKWVEGMSYTEAAGILTSIK